MSELICAFWVTGLLFTLGMVHSLDTTRNKTAALILLVFWPYFLGSILGDYFFYESGKGGAG